MTLNQTYVIRYTHTLTGYVGFVTQNRKVIRFDAEPEAYAFLQGAAKADALPHHGTPQAMAYEIVKVYMTGGSKPGVPDDATEPGAGEPDATSQPPAEEPTPEPVAETPVKKPATRKRKA